MTLQTGDVIRTAANSNVTLQFEDESRLLLHADSKLRLEQLQRFENTDMVQTQLKLERGRAESQVRPARGEGSRFDITTPSAVTAVRGTSYRVGAETATARAEVLEGEVGVANEIASVAVPAGFGTVVATGAAPEPPVKLLPPPDLSGLPAVVERVPMAFHLSPLAGALAYRLQLATEPEFKAPLYDARATSSPLQGPDLPDGEYIIRVRGIDARQLEGLNADHHFILNARPEPPFLISPPPDGAVPEEQPVFRWSESAGRTYHFQLASDPEFSTLMMDVKDAAGRTITARRALQPGKHYWRVAAIDPREGEGPFSDVQPFLKVPRRPPLEPPSIGEKEITVRWRAGSPDHHYHFQLAKDESFSKPIANTPTREAQVNLAHPVGGRYYMRVSTIDREGNEGTFGPTQAVDIPGKPVPRWLLLVPVIPLLFL